MHTFDDLRRLVAHATEPGKTFYREHYRLADDTLALALENIDEWRALPYIDKDVLTRTPLASRQFVPPGIYDHLRASSGTSGKPPVFTPRTYLRAMEYRRQYHDFKKPIIAYMVPAAPYWHEHFAAQGGHAVSAIVLDPKHMDVTARIAKAADADAISTFAYHIIPLGEALKNVGHAERIRFIEICGESCTESLFAYMRKTFLHATIIPFYGSSEVEDSPIGAPCRAITGEEPLSIYHAKPSQYHELIDPHTLAVIEPKTGAEGELVISAYPGEPSAFPLVRYRTGDMVRIVEAHCSTHELRTFTMIGRAELDFIKISGGVVRADEAERALAELGVNVRRFELHHFERQTDSGPKSQLELHVELNSPIDLPALATRFATAFRVAPHYTYTDGVQDGRYLPLFATTQIAARALGKSKKLYKH